MAFAAPIAAVAHSGATFHTVAAAGRTCDTLGQRPWTCEGLPGADGAAHSSRPALQAPLLFVGPYWHLTLPTTSITTYYLVCTAITFWSSGVAYALSALLPVNSVLVGTVFTCLIVGAFLSGTGPSLASARGTAMEYVLSTSYSRCGAEPDLQWIAGFGHGGGICEDVLAARAAASCSAMQSMPPRAGLHGRKRNPIG